VVFHAEPLDRRRVAGDAGRIGRGLHWVFSAGAGTSNQQISEWSAEDLARNGGRFLSERVPERGEPSTGAGVERNRTGTRADPRTNGYCLGAARPPSDHGSDRSP